LAFGCLGGDVVLEVLIGGRQAGFIHGAGHVPDPDRFPFASTQRPKCSRSV
jgi:hypothetical protein